MASAYVTELTRTNSDSSAVTADCSKDASSLHNDYSAPGPSTVWTDEKHSLYLDSLEAAFVNQLHNSIALRGCLQKILRGPYSSEAEPTNSCDSANQFMVLQDGSCQKINPKRHKLVLESTADSHFIQENSCVHHSTSSVKRSFDTHHNQEHSMASSERLPAGETSLFCSARISEQHYSYRPYHQISVGTAIEVSDQNFVNVRKKSNHRPTAKRLKRVSDPSSSDQFVPIGNPTNTSGASTAIQASLIREEQANQELRSENLHNFVYPNSEDQYFLRES